jgi:hypothetical protein
MSYESAPATKMLATHCMVCARPLLDAVSVELGIGPDCRKRLLPTELVNEELRAEANKLVHDIALEISAGSCSYSIVEKLNRLKTIGFTGLVDKFIKNQALIFVDVSERQGELHVKAPFDQSANWRDVPGSRWDPIRKVRRVPVRERLNLYRFLMAHWNGALGMGPKGPFIVGVGS